MTFHAVVQSYSGRTITLIIITNYVASVMSLEREFDERELSELLGVRVINELPAGLEE
jgi:hypothetical protein